MRLGIALWFIAFAASAAAPPLEPSEEIVKTGDGCGVVLRQKPDQALRDYFAQLAWGGACVDGLIMGEGVFGSRRLGRDGVYEEEKRGWAWYGRGLGNEPKDEKRRKEAEALAAKWRQQVGPEEVARRAALAQRMNEQMTLRGENHMRCWDTDRKIQDEYLKDYEKPRSSKQEAERAERVGRAYQELWSRPECATHMYAMDGLKKADTYFGEAARKRGQQEEWDRRQSERMARMLGAIAEGVTTFQNTQNALQQQQAPPSSSPTYVPPPAPQQNAPSAPQVRPSPQLDRSAQGGTAEPWKSPEQLRKETAEAQARREIDERQVQAELRNAGASQCLQLAPTTAYGGFKNNCGFPIHFVYCTLGSTGEGLTNFSDGCDCRRSSFCASEVDAFGQKGSLTAGAKHVIWSACKAPYMPLGSRFDGATLRAECRK